MATPANANFIVKTNGYWNQVWQINNNGSPINLSNYTFELQIRAAKGHSAKLYATLTDGSGITVDAANGKINIELAPLPLIKDQVNAYYDLIAIYDGKPYVWIQGRMLLDPGVSYVGP